MFEKGNVKAWFEVDRFRSMSTIFVSHQLIQKALKPSFKLGFFELYEKL